MKVIATRCVAFAGVAALLMACSHEPSTPESWTMSPDAFGPVTTQMPEAGILATGAFRLAPSACSLGRLDWHTQKYESLGDVTLGDGQKTDYGRVGPSLPSITLDGHGKPAYIDPGGRTETDKGIRRGASLTDLRKAYGDRLIAGATFRGIPAERHYAVNGSRSHLLFDVHHRKVAWFYLTPGTAKRGFYADMRGIGC